MCKNPIRKVIPSAITEEEQQEVTIDREVKVSTLQDKCTIIFTSISTKQTSFPIDLSVTTKCRRGTGYPKHHGKSESLPVAIFEKEVQ